MSKKQKSGAKADRAYLRGLDVAKLEFEVLDLQRANELDELDHKMLLAAEKYSGTFRLYGDVEPCIMEHLRVMTARFAAANPKAPIKVIISSPGGSVFDGFVLFDHLRALSDDGHKITTVVRGMAGSMAAVLAQAGDVRVIGPESYLVIHEAATMMWGKPSEVKDDLDVLKRLCRQAEAVFARRSKLSAAQIKARTKKTDWFVNAKQCKALGLADRIG